MQITYREMQDTDKKTITDMMYDFCKIYKDLDAQKININSPELAEWCVNDMLNEVAKHNGKVIVAEFEGKIVGFTGFSIKAQENEKLLFHRSHLHGYIHDLYIDDNYRNQQIGTKLLQLAEDYFKEQGCEFSRLTVFATNNKAHEFYKRNNYKDRNIDLIKQL